jgi:hypothetical protein
MNTPRILSLSHLRNLHRLVLPWVSALALITLASCGGGSTEPSTANSAVIGPAGGILTGPDGVQVVIPAGALTQDTTIGIARSSAGAPAAPEAYPAAGYIYELTPHGLTFDNPVTVRAPMPSGAATPLVFMASAGEDWKLLDAQVVNGVAEWQRNSFSNLLMGTACFVPTSMLNDPYWCVHSSSYARLTATPPGALVQTSPGDVYGISGDAGSYRVDQATVLHFKTTFKLPGNCLNATVTLRRFPYQGTSAGMWGPAQVIETKSPTITTDAHYVNGTATFDFLFDYQIKYAGKNHFSVVINYDCPGVTHSFSTVTGWDYSNYKSSYVGDGMNVDGNVPAPSVFYTVGGNVSGLTGTMVLQNNGGDNQTVTAPNSSFAFTPSAAGASYSVSVLSQPSGQICNVVTNGASNNLQADVPNVGVSCVTGPGWQGASLIETGNGNIPIVPAIAMDPNGDAFEIWVQQGSGYFPDILTNRYVAGSGWETATLMEASDTNVGIPSIAVQANGNAIAVWPQTNGIRDNIWASRYVVGSGWSTPLLIETNTAGNTYAPSIAIDPNGNAIAVWAQSDGTRLNIWANRYVAGTGWGTAQLIETDNAGPALYPRVAMDANGNAIAVWNQSDGTHYNAMANRYAAGSGWGTATLIETDNTGNVGSPTIAMDANGNAISVWAQYDGTRYNLWSNRYVAGTGWGTAALLENDNSGDADPGLVVMDANGNAMVAWHQFDGTNYNIWARRYVAGTGWDAVTLIATNTAGDTSIPSIAMNASGNAVAVWHQSDGTRTNIWANRYVDGTGWSTASLIENDDTGDAIYPSVVMDASGNAIATWLQSDGTWNNVMANVFK